MIGMAIASEIRQLSVVQFSVIMDGTQDISGTEQESICLRYIDENLDVHEEFVGLYEASSTTGESLAKIIFDVLLRLNLSLSNLRGQAYDGAANMAGKYAGAQAKVIQKQPLAPFVHCGAHCVNLVTQQACVASPLIRNALHEVNELGVLFGRSGKLKKTFKTIAASSHEGPVRVHMIRPLCPTRFTVRGSSVQAILNQYESVLETLQEVSTSYSSEMKSRAAGLLDKLYKGNTALSLVLANDVISPLENLNLSLQKHSQTISGTISAVNLIRESLAENRNEIYVAQLFAKAEDLCEKLSLDCISLPRQRKPPTRDPEEKGTAHQAESPLELFKIEYYKMLDAVEVQMAMRFNQPGIEVMNNLETMLLNGFVDDTVQQYSELNKEDLKLQLGMFKKKFSVKNVKEAVSVFKEMSPEMRGLFDQVETLIRLLLVVPASTAEAERSFSSLRRLKTWL